MTPRHRGRRPGLLTAASALMFFYGVMLGGLQLVIADVAAYYGVNTAGMGLVVSAQYLTATIAPICMGVLADRIGKKPVLTAFSAVFGIGCAVAGFSSALPMYVIGAGMIGAGYSVCESLSSAALSDLDAEKGMQYINTAQCTLSVGAVASPIFLRYCMRSLGANWRLVFYICAAAYLLLTLLLLRTPFPRAAQATAEKGERGSAVFFHSGMFVCLFVAMLLYVGLENGFGYFVDSLLDERGGAEASLSAFAISAYWAGMALSRFFCGLRQYSAGRMLRCCFLTIAGLFVLLISIPNQVVSVLISLLLGVAYGPVWSTLMARAALLFPHNSAGAIGMMSTGCALGGLVYPTLMGVLANAVGLRPAFLALVATALAGCAFCAKIREGHK